MMRNVCSICGEPWDDIHEGLYSSGRMNPRFQKVRRGLSLIQRLRALIFGEVPA